MNCSAKEEAGTELQLCGMFSDIFGSDESLYCDNATWSNATIAPPKCAFSTPKLMNTAVKSDLQND